MVADLSSVAERRFLWALAVEKRSFRQFLDSFRPILSNFLVSAIQSQRLNGRNRRPVCGDNYRRAEEIL